MADNANSDQAAGDMAKAQHDMVGITPQSEKTFQRTTHPDAQWFGNGGLGLFIHWGIACVHGKIDLSWGMMAGMPGFPDELERVKPSPEEYFKLAESFNPEKRDPERWLQAAKDAQFKYAVFTARHVDGFAMWPSKHGEFNIGQYLPGVDLVREYVEACRRVGLRVGIYYGPPDWYMQRHYMSFNYGSADQNRFPGRPHYGTRHQPVDHIPEMPKDEEERYHAVVRGQIEELLTEYGKIEVLFFDGKPEVISFDELRALQPGMVVNPRMHGVGDYDTPEGSMPGSQPDNWWELCECWPDAGWGYDFRHEEYRSTGWMLSRMAQIRGWAGNYLINVGPNADGQMPDVYYRRMAELGEWMTFGAESMFDTQAGPFPGRVNVPATIKGGTWYLHATLGFTGALEVRGVEPPASVTLLQTGQPLDHSFVGGTLTIDLPASVRTDLDDVVRVSWST